MIIRTCEAKDKGADQKENSTVIAIPTQVGRSNLNHRKLNRISDCFGTPSLAMTIPKAFRTGSSHSVQYLDYIETAGPLSFVVGW